MHTPRLPLAFVFGLAIAGVGACSSSGGDQLGKGDGGGGGTTGTCPAENQNCKEIATVEAGQLAVTRRKCGDCHDGPKGKMGGSTTNLATTQGVELYPPNLTNDEATGIGTWGDDQLAAAIRTGLDRQGLQLCPQMKHFADMSDFEVYSIVKYLRSLPKVNNKILRSVCPPLKTKDEQR